MAVYATSKGINCQTCSPVMAQFLGCTKDLASPVDVWGYKVTRCACYLSTPFDYALIQIYGEWKKGCYPHAGGWFDQTMKFSAYMNTLEGLMQKVEKE